MAGVLLDKDGTLIDFNKTWGPWARARVHQVARESGTPPSDVAATFGLDLARGEFLPDSPVVWETAQALAARLGPYYPALSCEEIRARLSPRRGEVVGVPVAGLAHALDDLRAMGMRLAVVTNDGEAQTRSQLIALGVAQAFDVVIGSDSGHGGKPAPDGCLAAARALGLRPETCVMVGDSLADLRAGAAAGMARVGVLTGVVARETLASEADVVLEGLADLPRWLAVHRVRR